MRNIVLALDLVRRARAHVPHYGVRPLSTDDVRHLLRAADLCLDRRPSITSAILYPPVFGSTRQLVVAAHLSIAAERFIALREVGRVLADNRSAHTAAEVFALIGVFDVEECKEGGTEWLGKRMLQLQDVGEDWYDQRHERLLHIVSEIVRFTGTAPNGQCTDCRMAYEIGRLARQSAHYEQALLWFKDGGRLATAVGDWETCVLCLHGVGNVYRLTGDYRRSEKAFCRSAEIARRESVGSLLGASLHLMMVAALNRGALDEAEDIALEAAEAYGKDHPRLPILANDVAYVWISRGQFARAVPVLLSALPKLNSLEDELCVFGSLGRAAGGAGDRDSYELAWNGVQERIMRVESDLYSSARNIVPGVLLDLAMGATMLQDWGRAVGAARRAEELAERYGCKGVRRSAEVVIAQANAHSAVGPTNPRRKHSLRVAGLSAGLVEWLGAAK